MLRDYYTHWSIDISIKRNRFTAKSMENFAVCLQIDPESYEWSCDVMCVGTPSIAEKGKTRLILTDYALFKTCCYF